MEKVLRRQVGADIVDIDTEEGTAGYKLLHPMRIDFRAIENAAHDAGYTLTEVVLEIVGQSFTTYCDECSADVHVLKIPQTDQNFELEGDVPDKTTLRLTGSAKGWGGALARLVVVASVPITE